MKPKDSFFLLIYNNTIEKKYEIRQDIVIIVYFKCCDVINSETTPHYLKPKTASISVTLLYAEASWHGEAH